MMRRFVIPSGVDIEKLVDYVQLFEPGTRRDLIRNRFVFFLSSVIYGQLMNEKNQKDSEGAYLMSTVLKKVMKRNYKQYIELMAQEGVISVGGTYLAQHYSKQYKLALSFQKSGLIEFPIVDTSFLKQVSKAFNQSCFHQNDDNKGRSKQLKRMHDPLRKVLDKGKLVIQETKARRWITYVHYHELKSYASNPRSNYHPDHKKYVLDLIVDGFAQRMYNYASEDYFGHRFHSLLTYCPSKLRRLMSWEGERLVAIDLKNSQPYLLNVMFQKSFLCNADTFSLRGLMPELHKYLMAEKEKKLNHLDLHSIPSQYWKGIVEHGSKANVASLFIMLHNVSQTLYSWGAHEVNFQSLTFHGELYEFISEQMKGKYIEGKSGSDRFGTRESTKREVMFMLYHDPSNRKSNFRVQAPYKDFVQLFPAQGTVLNLLKSKDYKDAPRLLQRVESHLFLEKIAKPLIKKGIPVLTIHDSIVVPEQFVKKAEQLMVSVLSKHVGQKPSIKLEYWGER